MTESTQEKCLLEGTGLLPMIIPVCFVPVSYLRTGLIYFLSVLLAQESGHICKFIGEEDQGQRCYRERRNYLRGPVSQRLLFWPAGTFGSRGMIQFSNSSGLRSELGNLVS
jgi:hypothetical protein